MKVYIRKSFDNEIASPNFYAAFSGFKQMGFEIKFFKNIKDLIGCGTYNEDPDILCSEVVNFAAEWRCFVRYGKILDIRRYRGDWKMHFDPVVVENAVSQFKSAPKGYAIDFGLTDKGETLLIEVNDGYSLGYYGLLDIDYAKLLSARWAELTGTIDECDF